MRLSSGRAPTVHDYVRAFLTQMRAPVKESKTFTVAGAVTIRKPGERILLAPDGTKLRVIENPGPGSSGGNQVEHGDHLHAHVRPVCATNQGTA